MTVARLLALTVGLSLTLVACREELPPSGQACVVGDWVIFDTAISHQVEVDFGGCVPTCGPGDVETGCEVIVDGRDIVIDAWILASDPESATCGSCVQPKASCDWPANLEGQYTVSYGESVTKVTLPEEDLWLCLNAEP